MKKFKLTTGYLIEEIYYASVGGTPLLPEDWKKQWLKDFEDILDRNTEETRKEDIKIARSLFPGCHLHLGNDGCSVEQVKVVLTVYIEALQRKLKGNTKL